jgi:hypothetical protein
MLYPTTPVPQFPYSVSPRWKTIITTFDTGAEQRRSKRPFAQYDVTLTYDVITVAEMQTLWNFYQSAKGSYMPFFFYCYESAAYANLLVGTGDAVTTIFDLPGKSTSSRTLYVNGAVQSSGFSYLTGGGQENSDRVQFTVAPAIGAIISADFTGYLRIRCRFKNDTLSRQMFEALLYKTGIELQGLNFV